ncbi:acyl-CoA dehydrogenase family protein [Streptomyces sp. NPDC054796]
MDFRLTEEQRALRQGMRDLLERRFSPDALRAAGRATATPDGQEGGGGAKRAAGFGLDRVLWRELGAAGFFGLRLPESAGGVGLGMPEAVLLFEEAGRALLPGPLVATHLTASGGDGCDGGAATGAAKGVAAAAARGEAVVTAVDGGLVEWLDEADTVLGDASGATPLRSVDPLTPLHRVPAPEAPETPETPEAAAPGLPVREAALLTAALQLGSASRTVAMAVDHARTRHQFGQPVGAFQAVKHLCAEMLVRAETARAAVYAAAVTGEAAETAGAKLLADEAAVRNARDCLQVHGGMGFTWESEVHLHLKRAWLRSWQWQDAAAAEEELAGAL